MLAVPEQAAIACCFADVLGIARSEAVPSGNGMQIHHRLNTDD